MTKRTATITWVTYHNFGTFLQAYALQKYVMSLGYDNAILNDSPIIGIHPNWKYKLKKLLMRIFSTEFRKYEKSHKQSDRMFDKFKRTELVVDSDVYDLSVLDAKYDIFICGSDQIWNPFSLDSPNIGFFYASFSKKKKIAYAPSIGVSKVPLLYKAKLKELTRSFDFISARELQGVDVLKELTGKTVVRVVDPTLLLDSSQWNLILPKKAPCREKYILAYFLTPNHTFINATVGYAREKGMRLKMFFTDKTYCNYDSDLVTAGPIEFMHYVRNAECLFTDSFHGSVFAGIFHTQFFTFKRFGQTERSQNSRVENLLNMMGISERLLNEENSGNIYKLPDIDFSFVEDNLAPFIIKSKEYLDKALQ